MKNVLIQNIKVTNMRPAGGNLVKVAPKAGSGHTCQKAKTGKCGGGSGGCKCGGAKEISKNAKTGGKRKQETITIVVLDDEALNRNSTGRMAKQAAGKIGFERENLNVLLAATVEQAMEHILNNEVALIVLDRKLEGGRWGREVLEQLSDVAPEKVDCAVMCTGSPLKVEAPVKEAIGIGRVFGKLREQPALMNLMEHVLGGTSVKEWRRPTKEELQIKEDEAPKEPIRRARGRASWL